MGALAVLLGGAGSLGESRRLAPAVEELARLVEEGGGRLVTLPGLGFDWIAGGDPSLSPADLIHSLPRNAEVSPVRALQSLRQLVSGPDAAALRFVLALPLEPVDWWAQGALAGLYTGLPLRAALLLSGPPPGAGRYPTVLLDTELATDDPAIVAGWIQGGLFHRSSVAKG